MAKAMVNLVDGGMVERKLPTPPTAEPAPTAAKESPGQPLNFRVPASFRREFRMYAADRGLRLNEVLVLAFKALKNEKND